MNVPTPSIQTVLITALVCASTASAAPVIVDGNIQLPQVTGSTVIATWSGSNARYVSTPTAEDPDAMTLEWTGNWYNSNADPESSDYKRLKNVNATFSQGGSFVLNSNLSSINATAPSSIYTMKATNTVLTAGTTDYAGPAFSKIILQLTPNGSNDRDLQLSPTLNIGGLSYDAADASFDSVHGFDGVDGGTHDDPNSQYYGYFGMLALVTYEWDLDALGYDGDYTAFDFEINLPQTHSALYEAQISVVNQVPEPSTYALIFASGAVLVTLLRRRFKRR